MKIAIVTFAALSLLLLAFISCGDKKPVSTENNIDAESVYMLLDLMGTLLEKNPDYKAIVAKMDALNSKESKGMLDELILKNDADPDISNKISALLESPTYKLYYRQFNNINYATHKMVLLALPYASLPTPGGVSQTLYEVCMNLDKVKSWVDKIIPQVDLTKSHNLAVEWLPEGEYKIPPVHFIIDGNGDAFARDGEVCFDLYSVLMRELPYENRYDILETISVSDVEKVLGHELFHIYALPYLIAKDDPKMKKWQNDSKERLTKQLVTEGIAMQCDSLSGFRKVIHEDSTVVKYWIGQLNNVMRALDDDKITEAEFKKWYGETFFAVPRSLLNDYFSKDYQGDELEQKVIDNLVDRPALIYTLGWWMISNILKTENGKAKVIGIVSDYKTIFKEYNKSLPENSDELKIIF